MAGEFPPLEEVIACRVRPASTALVRTLPDGSSVVLDLETEKYFGLDSVGAEMWEALTAHPRVKEARNHLLTIYDVDEEKLSSDLAEFIGTLRSRGLVEVIEDD